MIDISHAPLFTGINGFGHAADVLGWRQPMHCEINDFCQRIIQYYWKNSKPYYDITKTDFTIWRGKIDVLSGGFPCQPFSNAGNRNGVDDHRYLWPEYLRAIRESKPIAVVGENVTGLLTMEQHEMFARVDSRGIVRFENYDQYEAVYSRQATMLVNDICGDLEKEGYGVQPFVVPAAGVGAPHKRDRIWFIAYANGTIKEYGQGKDFEAQKEVWWNQEGHVPGELHGNGPVADSDIRSRQEHGFSTGRKVSENRIERIGIDSNTHCNRFQGRGHSGELSEKGEKRNQRFENLGGFSGGFWENFPTQPPVCGRNDGLPPELDGITFSNWRKESIKAYGNAIVPQVAYQFFKAIDEQIRNSRGSMA